MNRSGGNTNLVLRSLALVPMLVLGAWLGLPREVAADPAVYELGHDPGVGFNLISWWNFGGSGASTWQNAVQSVYDAGFREVSISPVRFVDIAAGSILSTSPRGPELSHIEAGVVRAKSLGMRVTLNPFVELYDASQNQYFADLPGGCTWRGCFNPAAGSMSTTFWNDYQNYHVAVAQIAQTHGVEAMTVGTEYNAIDGDSRHNADWNNVINAVDAAYSGQIGYAANWDHYNHSNVATAIWDHPAIDFIGIDSYFTGLVSNSQADNSHVDPAGFLQLVTDNWNSRLENQILPFATARKGGDGMPVAFTEVGYLPYNRTSVLPQNNGGAIDTDEQTMAFNGLVNALDGRGDLFHAMHVWQWGMPGSNGSQWNMDTTLPADQPNNLAASQWLAGFVNTAVAPLAGDYNRDGRTDAADYTVWRDTLGQFVLNFGGADGNGNGIVDDDDYAVWKTNFGGTAGGGSHTAHAVPEPATASLALVVAVGLLLPRLVRRRIAIGI